MKKFFPLFLALVVCLAFPACRHTNILDFPFNISDVDKIEIFYYTVPGYTEKKIITGQGHIEKITGSLSGIELKSGRKTEAEGKPVISFRFCLAGGSDFVVIYNSEAVKSGTIRFNGSEKIWHTSADVESIWKNCDADIIKADEKELPSVS